MRPPEERAEPAAAIQSIAAIAARTGDPGSALREILAVVAGAIPSDSGAISVLNPDTGLLETEADFGMPATREIPDLRLGQGIAGWAAWQARAVLSPDTLSDPRYRPLRPGVRCRMAAPMLSPGGQALGVIALDRDDVGTFNEADLEFLKKMTAEASLVMQRLWELGHLKEKARQLEALLTAGQGLVAQLEPQQLFRTLTADTRRMMRARACAFYLHDPDAATVRLASYVGEGPVPSGEMPVESCLVSAAIRTRRTVSFPNIQSPEFRALPDLPGDPALRSVLAAAVTSESGVMGVLAVFTDTVRRFDDGERRLCAILAGLAGVALQNARLYTRVFQSEESLRKNERLTTLGLLAAEIAHEIRNPLTVIKLLQDGLGAGMAEGDPRRTDLRVIGEKLDQLEGIVSRVLNFARAPASLHTRCSLVDTVEDTLVLMRLKLAQAKIHVRFERPGHPAIVEGHKGQLQQVLLNLLINSMQAMPDGGSIALRISCDAGKAMIDVSDTGTGIPEAMRGRIFDSFLSSRPEGTGLGLAVAKRVMLGHHGDIALVSTGPAGTTMRLTLPLVK